MRISLILAIASVILTTLLPGAMSSPLTTPHRTPSQTSPHPWTLPIAGVSPKAITKGFIPPAGQVHSGHSGHRGVDFPAVPGTAVHAVGAGVVFFSGVIAGKPTVSILHGIHNRFGPRPIRSTYEPVLTTLSRGDYVHAGQLIGFITAGNSHCSFTCLHLGLKVGADIYIDPTALWVHSSWLLPSARG